MNGVLVVNKEQGMTSFDVIREIKKHLKMKKIGHAGTLDPLATGVLIVLLGEATKLSNYLMANLKEYEFDMAFGIKTDTEDITGNVIEQCESIDINNQMIDEAIKSLIGEVGQIPPMYSAIKKNGKKLYELARQGITIERDERIINIYNIERTSDCYQKDGFNCVRLKALVSKGTYIRTLATQIAEALNTIGTMTTLNRLSSGSVTLADSYSLDDIKSDNFKVVSMIDATKNYYQFQVDENLKNKVLHGMKIAFRDLPTDEEVIFFVDGDTLLGIYKRQDVCYKAERVWN